MSDDLTFPPFSLTRLLRTVFAPAGGERVAVMIDLDDPGDVIDFAFLKEPRYTIQRYAHDVFYRGLLDGTMAELDLRGGQFVAYRTTGGSNLDLPNHGVAPDRGELSLARDIYSKFDIILCVSTYSATAPLTASAKTYGFRGATLHGVNETILNSGLCVDYNEVSRDAEKLRAGMDAADSFELDFEVLGERCTLTLVTAGQSAQKSHGLCRGPVPDVANLPAGEIYYVPRDAEGEFPLRYDDQTIGIMRVADCRIQEARLLRGDPAVVDAHNRKLREDPVTGEIGELGFGTQVLPVSGADIQDEKILGTLHVATGRSDHLGGDLTPDRFAVARNAVHDDILFSPTKTPETRVPQVRMNRQGRQEILIENFQPAAYMVGLLEA